MGLLRQAVVAGPAYVELDLEIAKKIPRFGETKRVIAHTSLDEPLGNIDAIFEEASKANADVVKFTWPTPTLEAAWPLLAAVTKKRNLPVVGMGIGRAGLTFSLLGRKFGSPWIYAALERGIEAYEDQATVWDLEERYSWNEIGSGTRFVGLVGFGASDSTTVRPLNAGFKSLDLNTRCLPLEIASFDKLAQMLEILRINALVISPAFATRMLPFAQHVEPAAQESGFADLLLKQSDGWHAYNLISRSTISATEQALGKTKEEDHPLDRRNVLLVGANGIAQAIAYGIHKGKGIISVTSPHDKQAQKLAKIFDVRHVPFANLYDTLADVVIITDPSIVLGHRKTELNPSYLRPSMTVADLSRLPHDTDFLSEGRTRGSKTIDPRQVFIEHASAQFKAVTGNDLPEAVRQETQQLEP